MALTNKAFRLDIKILGLEERIVHYKRAFVNMDMLLDEINNRLQGVFMEADQLAELLEDIEITNAKYHYNNGQIEITITELTAKEVYTPRERPT